MIKKKRLPKLMTAEFLFKVSLRLKDKVQTKRRYWQFLQLIKINFRLRTLDNHKNIKQPDEKEGLEQKKSKLILNL